jgi:uncharacterized protein
VASNTDLHQKLDQALLEGDMDTARELLAEDLVFHVSGESRFSGEHRGRDAFFELFGTLNDLTGGTFSSEHRETLDNDGYSIALSKVSATRDDKQLDGDVVDICRWQDGQVVEEWIVPFDQREADAFWS